MNRRGFVGRLLSGLALVPAAGLLIDIPKAKAPPLVESGKIENFRYLPGPRVLVCEKWVRTGFPGDAAFVHTRSYVDGGRVQHIQDHVGRCPFMPVSVTWGSMYEHRHV